LLLPFQNVAEARNWTLEVSALDIEHFELHIVSRGV